MDTKKTLALSIGIVILIAIVYLASTAGESQPAGEVAEPAIEDVMESLSAPKEAPAPVDQSVLDSLTAPAR